jgi:hypothetical protein
VDAFDFRGADESAVEVLGPAVVSAAKQFAGTASFGGRAGAVAAHVVKAAQDSVVAADEQQRFAHQLGREIVAGTGDLGGVTNHLPGAGEYLFFLCDEYGWVCVELGRKRPGAGYVRLNDEGIGFAVERFIVHEILFA